LGWWLGPTCGLVDDDAARAGLLVFAAVNLGALVSGAVSRDLELTAPSSRMGRGGLLNRMAPTVYAAPVYFHYLNYFAP
jgi:predicted CDP-diglyceride synthetase/phosphatidate cytidylyltransferase